MVHTRSLKGLKVSAHVAPVELNQGSSDGASAAGHVGDVGSGIEAPPGATLIELPVIIRRSTYMIGVCGPSERFSRMF